MRIGTDIGGTFTDVVISDGDAFRALKLLTSANDPAEAVLEAIEQASVAPVAIDFVSHGTTLAINAIVERSGASTGLIANAGMEDVIEMRRGSRTHIIDPLMEKPPNYVRREWRVGLSARLDKYGAELSPVVDEDVLEHVRDLRQAGITSIAVCLLHSYANPAHELQVRDIVHAAFPDLFVTLSAELVSDLGEYERTSTAVLNAYVHPRVAGYLERLETELSARGIAVPLSIMQSNGGLTTASRAARYPVRILESGPAAGAVAAARCCSAHGHLNAIAFDMGGTTAKAAVIENGRPVTTLSFELFEEADKPGSGIPIKTPMIEIIEIGAGGGSIAHLDADGRLQVGPESAGADPGPVAYGHGGAEPTVTDAHAVLGRLEALVGGSLELDVDAARLALADRVARPLGLSIEHAASGVLELARLSASSTIRELTVARGKDPREFTLIAYGGAGPLEAAALARELEMPHVIIPNMPGSFSALGLLTTDFVCERLQAFLRPLIPDVAEELATSFEALARAVSDELRGMDFADDHMRHRRSARLRYVGQLHDVVLDVPDSELDAEGVRQMLDAFHREHERLFAYALPGQDVELVALAVEGTGLLQDKAAALGKPIASSNGDLIGRRNCYFEDQGWTSSLVVPRASLTAGAVVNGPAIIEELTATTLVPPGSRAEVYPSGDMLITTGAQK